MKDAEGELRVALAGWPLRPIRLASGSEEQIKSLAWPAEAACCVRLAKQNRTAASSFSAHSAGSLTGGESTSESGPHMLLLVAANWTISRKPPLLVG